MGAYALAMPGAKASAIMIIAVLYRINSFPARQGLKISTFFYKRYKPFKYYQIFLTFYNSYYKKNTGLFKQFATYTHRVPD